MRNVPHREPREAIERIETDEGAEEDEPGLRHEPHDERDQEELGNDHSRREQLPAALGEGASGRPGREETTEADTRAAVRGQPYYGAPVTCGYQEPRPGAAPLRHPSVSLADLLLTRSNLTSSGVAAASV